MRAGREFGFSKGPKSKPFHSDMGSLPVHETMMGSYSRSLNRRTKSIRSCRIAMMVGRSSASQREPAYKTTFVVLVHASSLFRGRHTGKAPPRDRSTDGAGAWKRNPPPSAAKAVQRKQNAGRWDGPRDRSARLGTLGNSERVRPPCWRSPVPGRGCRGGRGRYRPGRGRRARSAR